MSALGLGALTWTGLSQVGRMELEQLALRLEDLLQIKVCCGQGLPGDPGV